MRSVRTTRTAAGRCIWSALLFTFVQLGIAQSSGQDSARWRIGVSAQFGQLTWLDQYSLGRAHYPLYLVAFFNDRENDTRSNREGSRDLELLGIVLQNRNADQFEFQLGYQDYRFEDYEHTPDFPRYVYYNNRIARLEYTRTTSARDRKVKPSFGVRYGGAVFLRSGVSTSRYHYPQGNSGFKQYLVGQGGVLSLQPTVWCGYRSARVSFGVQLHWNVLAHAWGELKREEYWREGLEQNFVDSTAHFSNWLTVDSFLASGLFLNDISLKLTLNLVGVGKRQAIPEPRARKGARKDVVAPPLDR